ncbi:MAG: T9SS type A sorting domain-containing protein [Candidatus Cloacimonetes bacterium]|nr:T9SS type A sorting domain-containing protein [Candidatus Cloacimonadota bacterium]MCK9183913.1 T9SS type A sorting domain-containing protein [Candidatus Cloacimonadota bacterium]
MKQIYTLFMVVLLPFLAHAGLLDRIQQLGNNFPKSPSRDYRLSHQISSDFEEGAWVPSAKSMLYYSDSHPAQPDSITMHMWEEGSWSAPVQYIYNEYNAAGMVTSSIMMMNFGFETVPFFRSEAFFDAQNRIIHYNMFNIDFEDMQTWVPVMREHFVYGPNTEFEIYSWENDEETGDYFSHSTFSYDSSGRFTQGLYYESPDSTNWVLDSKTDTVYHPQDNSTGADIISYFSNMFGSIFSLMIWDMPMMISSETSYLWENEDWTPDYRTVWEYDGSLRRIRQDDDYWQTDQWVTEDKTFYDYDANGNMASSVMQSDYTGTWEDESKTEYFWDSFVSNDDLVQDLSPALQITAWPMPFSGSLNISTTAKSGTTPQISIYNSRGQLIRKFTGLDKLIWDGKDSIGRDSANGIYFIRAKQDQASAVSKVIRVK